MLESLAYNRVFVVELALSFIARWFLVGPLVTVEVRQRRRQRQNTSDKAT